MEIDVSAANEFRTCPMMYFNKRLADGTGLQLKSNPYDKVSPLDFGSRMHELWEEYYNELRGSLYYLYPQSLNEVLEQEAQIMIAAYRAKYPSEPFEIIDVERTFKIELPAYCKQCYQSVNIARCPYCGTVNSIEHHIGVGKIDVVFREENGQISIMDHKTENRQGNSNHPKIWAAKDQASFYLWVAKLIYPGEEIGRFYVNVAKRQSEKGQVGPVFLDRQPLERTNEQLEIAVRDLVIEADNIERYKAIFKDGLWPSNKQACTKGAWGDCEFYMPCTYGWDPLIKEKKYQKRTEYLNLAGIPIVQS
jgi:hypothetical protein